MTVETCDECGFDSRAWRPRDVAALFEGLGEWWARATAGVPSAELGHRPGPGVWSVLEYGFHSAMVTAFIRSAVEQVLAGGPGPALPSAPADADQAPALELDPAEVVSLIAREGAEMDRVASGRATVWTAEAERLLRHAAHDASHHLMDAGRGLARFAPPLPAGRLDQINISPGGVPKLPIRSAGVSRSGVEGDKQSDRKHHGRPFQAVCLWSAEVIAGLVGEGHRLYPGAAGENFTVSGLDWGAVGPGTLLRIGPDLVVELSWPAPPCGHQTQWFLDGDYMRIDYGRDPTAVRWYGWVRRPGHVAVGSPVLRFIP